MRPLRTKPNWPRWVITPQTVLAKRPDWVARENDIGDSELAFEALALGFEEDRGGEAALIGVEIAIVLPVADQLGEGSGLSSTGAAASGASSIEDLEMDGLNGRRDVWGDPR